MLVLGGFLILGLGTWAVLATLAASGYRRGWIAESRRRRWPPMESNN